jgi:hypothetical protein
MQCQDGHISTCFNKKILVIYIYVVQMLVPVFRYLFICVCLFVNNRSFILFIVRLFVFIFIDSLLIYCSKEKKNNSDPEPCSGISILLPVQVPVVPVQVYLHTTSSFRVNKHCTSDSTDFVLV